MKAALIGVGQAGGKIAERLVQFDVEVGFDAVHDALAVNSAKSDFQSLEYVDTQLIGADEVGGHGVGGDRDLGAEIMRSDRQQVLDELEGRITAAVESIFVIAGLGGGTGGGGAPILVDALQQIYDVPVYTLGILPGRNESALYQVNAGHALEALADTGDTSLLIDNDAWHEQGESVEGAFETINENIATRIGLLLGSGEIATGGEKRRLASMGGGGDDVTAAASVVDSSEVINTLRPGNIATVGYSSAPASEDRSQNVRTVTSIARQALLTDTGLQNVTSADSALLIVAGNPDAIARKGVEKARSWLGEEVGTMTVRGGDVPRDSDRLEALVVLGGAKRSDRVNELLSRARDADQEQNAQEQNDPTDGLIDDRIEDLL